MDPMVELQLFAKPFFLPVWPVWLQLKTKNHFRIQGCVCGAYILKIALDKIVGCNRQKGGSQWRSSRADGPFSWKVVTYRIIPNPTELWTTRKLVSSHKKKSWKESLGEKSYIGIGISFMRWSKMLLIVVVTTNFTFSLVKKEEPLLAMMK